MRTQVVGATFLLLFAVACGNSPTRPSTDRVPPRQPTPPAPTNFMYRGTYTLTLTASPSCSFPAEIKKRSYVATVEEYEAGSMFVTLTGAEFLQGFSGFRGHRDGDTLNLDISVAFVNGVMEIVDHAKTLVYDGAAQATISEGKISGTYNGRMALFDSPSPDWSGRAPYECTATDHKIEFVR